MKKQSRLRIIIIGILILCFTVCAFLGWAKYALFAISVLLLIYVSLNRARVKSFAGRAGKREARASHAESAVTFADVAANQTAKQSLMEIVDFLKYPERFQKLGARIPHGVMLYGPPGTGKTLLARALAGEAGVPFFAMCGSDFVEMYVGVGAGRVREAFRDARKAGKCVIFIDEIDALGKARGASGSEERDQTLNALLSEMSGFKPTDGIIVVAATNRLEMLDAALLRPGRFDRRIEVGLPGRAEREDILRLHSRNKPLAADISLSQIATETVCFSGASLENLLNEAAIRAARRLGDTITREDFMGAFVNVVAGADKPMIADDLEKRRIALHEAGHAVATLTLFPGDHITRVSILPAGNGSAGYNLCIPQERALMSKKEIESRIQVLLAGRAAELLMQDEDSLSGGASNDLSRAAELAGAMIMELGMAGEPAVCMRAVQKVCPGAYDAAAMCRQKLAQMMDAAMKLLIDRADLLTDITQALVKNEALTGAQIDEIARLDRERKRVSDKESQLSRKGA